MAPPPPGWDWHNSTTSRPRPTPPGRDRHGSTSRLLGSARQGLVAGFTTAMVDSCFAAWPAGWVSPSRFGQWAGLCFAAWPVGWVSCGWWWWFYRSEKRKPLTTESPPRRQAQATESPPRRASTKNPKRTIQHREERKREEEREKVEWKWEEREKTDDIYSVLKLFF